MQRLRRLIRLLVLTVFAAGTAFAEPTTGDGPGVFSKASSPTVATTVAP